MRVALIGPSHWHYEMYRPGLQSAGVQVVGVADGNEVVGRPIAMDWQCGYWNDYHLMIEQLKPDFVFAFGRHSEMPAIAIFLLRKNIPFSIEKPCGTSSEDVQQVAAVAERMNAFVSVPFHYRLSSMRLSLESLAVLPSSKFQTIDFRIIAGSPLRYIESSPWLVEPLAAGGGCMMNLAHHAVDFIVNITGSSVAEVEATMSSSTLQLDVEDSATLVLRLRDGCLSTIRTGYTHPAVAKTYMDFGFEAGHQTFTARSDDAGLVVTRPDTSPEHISTNWRFKDYFSAYVVDTLRRYRNGDRPVASLADLQATMDVVQAAYRSARLGRSVTLD